ncbi:uncharacterized protein GIQ15_04585 [Arthroderma uncinatum]|uniref:uncharacterized protein n=1 Tax=Arthroderma uncinatum TaxID=74035 RepID=UPI00144AA86F|nr:uncharacterized protein GIQ15_04585 [Arthroderma uncinatum]KAF3481826.1 hypothetical protein GIQ15_04585 [Arthroderma uncinatum]
MKAGVTGCLGEDGIHVDMEHLKKGEVKYVLPVSPIASTPANLYIQSWYIDERRLTRDSMAINFKDGVILGADSRTTTGSYIANRVTDKLTQVHDTIWCCRSGSAADTQAVADIVKYHLGMYGVVYDRQPTTQTAAALFQELCYDNKDALSAGIIIAGYDPRHGGQVYSIPLGGSLHKQPYAIGGSGSTYIYGYCDANWREGMDEAEGVEFVKNSLREAIKWDGSSGGVIRMVVLTRKGAILYQLLCGEPPSLPHHFSTPATTPTPTSTSTPSTSTSTCSPRYVHADMGAVACAPLQPPMIASNSSRTVSMLSAGLKRELSSHTETGTETETRTTASSTATTAAASNIDNTTAPVESAPASMSASLHQYQRQHASASTASLPASTHPHNHQRLPDRQRPLQSGLNGHDIHSQSQPAFRPLVGPDSPPAASAASVSASASASTSTSPPTPTRIKVRDLSHIQSFASEEALATPSHRTVPQRQYEISSMPVTDVIEMVAGLLTKITTTNDLQHEHLHRHIPRPEVGSLPPQTTSVLAFHGKNVPGITILNYLSRIHKYCPTTYEVFISLLVYFDRMTETVNSHLLQQMQRRAHLRPNPNPSIRTMSTSSSNRPHTSSSSPFFSPSNPGVGVGAGGRRFSSRRSTETSVARAGASKLPTSPTVDLPMRSPSLVQDDHDVEHDLSDSDDDLSDDFDELNFSHFLVVDSYNIHRLVIAGVTCASKFFSDVFYTNSRYAKVGGLPLIELNHLELQFLLLNDFRLAVPVEELDAYGTMLVQFYAREIVAQQRVQAGQQPSVPQPGFNATAAGVMQSQPDP